MVMSCVCTKMIITTCQLDNTGQWESMDVVKIIDSILKDVNNTNCYSLYYLLQTLAGLCVCTPFCKYTAVKWIEEIAWVYCTVIKKYYAIASHGCVFTGASVYKLKSLTKSTAHLTYIARWENQKVREYSNSNLLATTIMTCQCVCHWMVMWTLLWTSSWQFNGY